MGPDLNIKDNINSYFFNDDPSCPVKTFEDLFRALGKRPQMRRQPKLESKPNSRKPKL